MLEQRMKPRTNPFQKHVSEYARLFHAGKKLPPGCPRKFAQHPKVPGDMPKALIFSPHPDDECIVGGLALRLSREAGWNVINVAVTLGGKKERRAARLCELKNACAFIGFALLSANLEDLNPAARSDKRAHWRAAVKVIAKVLAVHQPRAIFIPHAEDRHPAHIGTHHLVLDALKTLPACFACHVVETEYWGQMTDPNLLVESCVADVAGLVAALACHVGEVRRNPYHARLPAWLLDNVRRGAELVGGPGAAAPDFTFATIYRLRKWANGRLTNLLRRGIFLSRAKNPARLFP